MARSTKPVSMVSEVSKAQVIGRIAAVPPALTRLEPQSVSGDPGARRRRAVVADPLWMIGRQWQLGELLGEDVGNPVSVRRGAAAHCRSRRGCHRRHRRRRPPRRRLAAVAGGGGARRAGRARATPGRRARPAVAGRDRRPARRHAARRRPRRRCRPAGRRLTRSTLAPTIPADPDGVFDPARQVLLAALAGAVADGGLAAGGAGGRRPVVGHRGRRCVGPAPSRPSGCAWAAGVPAPAARGRRPAWSTASGCASATATTRSSSMRRVTSAARPAGTTSSGGPGQGRARRRREPGRAGRRDRRDAGERRCGTRACPPTATGSSRTATSTSRRSRRSRTTSPGCASPSSRW